MRADIPILLTARLKSTRLPGKHLLALWREVPAIACLIRRLGRCGAHIILCLPEADGEAPLVALAEAEGIAVFAGDAENVLRRYQTCLSDISASSGIIVDADDVLISVETVCEMLNIDGAVDYVKAEGLPFGGAPTRLSLTLLERMLDANTSPNGWSLSAQQFSRTSEVVTSTGYPAEASNLRLSLDYPEDYDFLRHLFSHFETLEQATLRAAVDMVAQHKTDFEESFPALFDGSIAARAGAHLRGEISAWSV